VSNIAFGSTNSVCLRSLKALNKRAKKNKSRHYGLSENVESASPFVCKGGQARTLPPPPPLLILRLAPLLLISDDKKPPILPHSRINSVPLVYGTQRDYIAFPQRSAVLFLVDSLAIHR